MFLILKFCLEVSRVKHSVVQVYKKASQTREEHCFSMYKEYYPNI